MKFITLLTLAATVLAAPRLPAIKPWTIEGVKRSCDAADTKCTWHFTVNTHSEGITPTNVDFVVEASNGAPASRSVGKPSAFGKFTVTSAWSDAFGDAHGWTTLSLVDNDRKLITFPAYTDEQVRGGATVRPDQTYLPEHLRHGQA